MLIRVNSVEGCVEPYGTLTYLCIDSLFDSSSIKNCFLFNKQRITKNIEHCDDNRVKQAKSI